MKDRSSLYLIVLISLGILTLLGKELLIVNPELFHHHRFDHGRIHYD